MQLPQAVQALFGTSSFDKNGQLERAEAKAIDVWLHLPQMTFCPPGEDHTLPEGQIQVWADDGNESSYGHEIWEVQPDGTMKCVASYGRDCFEDNVSDHLEHFEEGYVGTVCTVEQFLAAVQKGFEHFYNRAEQVIEETEE